MLVEGKGGISKRKRHHKLSLEEKGEKNCKAIASYIGERLYLYPPAARNQPSWVLTTESDGLVLKLQASLGLDE